MRSATRLAVLVSFLALTVFTTELAVAQNGNGNGNPHIPKLIVDADGSHLTPLARGFMPNSATPCLRSSGTTAFAKLRKCASIKLIGICAVSKW